jgi:hypothetical protein
LALVWWVRRQRSRVIAAAQSRGARARVVAASRPRIAARL